MVRFAGIYLLFLLVASQANGQLVPGEYGPNDTVVVYVTFLEDGTPVPTSALEMVEVVGRMPKWMAKNQRKSSRLRNAVYVTYPYAREASRVIVQLERQLAAAKNEKDRKDIIKRKEKELKESFGDRLMQLSVYQGKVLMKLINRQTGADVFAILKEYKGGANARFWQTVAFVFGSNLKQPYDPKGSDAEMEGYVKEVQLLYGDA
jgi:hypothetical protein